LIKFIYPIIKCSNILIESLNYKISRNEADHQISISKYIKDNPNHEESIKEAIEAYN